MLLEFFLENARIEPGAGGSGYVGQVKELPELRVEAATPEECRAKLAEAIAGLLAFDGGRRASDDPRLAARASGEADGPARQAQETGGKKARTFEPRDEAGRAGRASEQAGAGELNFSEILYEKGDWVARVTINRPEVYNAYSSTTLREMTAAFRDAARDDEVAVVVLTGAGDRAFCTGSDMKQHSEEHVGQPGNIREWVELLIDTTTALRRLGKPSIARINGIVAGGGNDLNLSCDLAVAADHAKFTHVETKIGIVSGCGAPQWLPLIIGERRAREMLMTGDPVSAHKAHLWGLVNDVVPYDELDQAVFALCRKLIDRFPECQRYTRKELDFWKDFVWEQTIEQAREWLTSQFEREEAVEGMRALAERREVDYRSFRPRRDRGDTGEEAIKEESNRAETVSKTRSCNSCGASRLPATFPYCGLCGARL